MYSKPYVNNKVKLILVTRYSIHGSIIDCANIISSHCVMLSNLKDKPNRYQTIESEIQYSLINPNNFKCFFIIFEILSLQNEFFMLN